MFYKYGRIIRCDVKVGFGFVEYEDRRDAEDAVRDLVRPTLPAHSHPTVADLSS
jgi:hypothetical protein